MIKAAFFDVDGTILSHKTKRIPPSTRDAIARLQEKGIACIVCTGRQITAYEQLPVADIPFDGYIMLNGQMILDKNKNLLQALPITGKTRDFLVRSFREHAFPAMIVELERSYINYVDDRVRQVQKNISSPVPEIGTYEGADFYQVCAYLTEENEHLLAPLEGECVMTRWTYGGQDIIAKDGGKDKGIQTYIDRYGWTREETIAFGDGENDADMVRFAGIGVAMGNGKPGTKAAADYVTDDIDEDGLYNALAHFGLL